MKIPSLLAICLSVFVKIPYVLAMFYQFLAKIPSVLAINVGENIIHVRGK